MRFGRCETISDQLDLMLWGLDTPLGLLLERVQDVDCVRKADRVYDSVSVSIVPLNDLKDRRPRNDTIQGLFGEVSLMAWYIRTSISRPVRRGWHEESD